MSFKKATKAQSRLRMSIIGPSGSGKTYTALGIGTRLAERCGGRLAVLDTERGSADKYGDIFDFDVDRVTDKYHPNTLISKIKDAESAGYKVVLIDSLTHFWNGEGGFLSLVDEHCAKQKARSGGRFDGQAAWKDLTPLYNKVVETVTSSSCHVIMNMRAKTEYIRETDEKGKTSIRKAGMAPEMRDTFTYEVDLEMMLDQDHNGTIMKTRMGSTFDGHTFKNPGGEFADSLYGWLTSGASTASDVKFVADVIVPGSADDSLFDTLKASIEGCLTMDGMKDVRVNLETAKAEGKLPNSSLNTLIGLYKTKMGELKKIAAVDEVTS